ncbi:acyltransferase family protein [Legionella nagasakiensis]|uniref:acyltransferase family protein n=1 Tax=Legionella nagasakiensis TaxID=535290 RepID=UPI001055C3DC|nr:acyltransferase family protein [Legionella nagasakiensis]
MTRLAYLDHLKWALIILVLAHHVGIAFGGMGEWYYIVPQRPSPISFYWLTWFLALNQSFFMGFFFFISALFTPLSFDKKGQILFLKDKCLRLMIPALMFFFIFSPLVVAMASFFDHHALNYAFSFGPTWFLVTLFAFNLLYSVYRYINLCPSKLNVRLPSQGLIILMGFLIGCITFLLRLYWPIGTHWHGFQFGYYPMYLFLFATGIIAVRNDWLNKFNAAFARPWYIGAFISMGFIGFYLQYVMKHDLMTAVMGGFNWYAFLWTQWEAFSAFSLIISLLALSQIYFNNTNPMFQTLTKASFTVYLIHPLIIVPMSYYEYQWLGYYGIAGWVLTCLLAIPLTFLLANYFRKLPILNNIL